MKRFAVSTIIFCLAGCTLQEEVRYVPVQQTPFPQHRLPAFEKRLEKLRRQYHIPSLSMGVVHNRKLVWYKGLGYADLENKIQPDTHTVYHIASVTKTFGSLILMQQIESQKASLEDPIKNYHIDLGGRYSSDSRIKVKHLLSHTAHGSWWNWYTPGFSFRYNGDWYAQLEKVIKQASDSSFGALLMHHVINPLQLKNTVPSLDDSAAFALTGYNRQQFQQKVAKPYNWQGHHWAPIQSKYRFSPSAGLMSSVNDLAIYSIAIDEQLFLQPESWEQLFTPFRTPFFKKLQYGLGWYVKEYNGMKVMWHTGWWWGYSALFIKVPAKDLTFIALANSQDLSRPFYLTMYPAPVPWFGANLGSDLLVSDFANAFFEYLF